MSNITSNRMLHPEFAKLLEDNKYHGKINLSFCGGALTGFRFEQSGKDKDYDGSDAEYEMVEYTIQILKKVEKE